MFRDLPRHAAYKSNSSLWLGDLPAHWSLARTKTLLTERSQKGYPDESLLAATQSHGVIRKSDYETRTVTATKDLHLLKLVEVGDFVISLRSFQGGIERCYHRGIISPAYTVLTAHDDSYRDYLTYLFKSSRFIDSLTLAVTGIREGQNIDYSRLAVDLLPVPPVEEQAAIVKYLAHANARIDNAIAAKRRLIALLNEYSIAELDEIVHGGDGANASVGQTSMLVQTGPFGSQLHAEDYVDGGVPVINPSHLIDGRITPDAQVSVTREKAAELQRHQLRQGDVVIARRGDLGRCAVVAQDEQGWLCGTGSALIRLRPEDWDPNYFQMIFSSKRTKETLELWSIGSTMANLNASQVSCLRLRRPALADQLAAVERAVKIQNESNLRCETVFREIALLQEFRTRLVADVVTGQVDVRAVAETLPDPPMPDVSLDEDGIDLGDLIGHEDD